MNDMNPPDNSDDLQARLRALPAERLPPARVWQGIAAQLPAMPMPAPAPAAVTVLARRRRWPLRVGLGMAAALGGASCSGSPGTIIAPKGARRGPRRPPARRCASRRASATWSTG